MAGEAQTLSEMLSAYNTMALNLSASLVNIDNQIDDLTEQKTILQWTQDQYEADLETYVEANKADYFYSYGSFGSTNLSEWMGFDEETGLTNLTYFSAHEFLVDGDETGTFTAGTSAVVTNNGVFSTSTTVSASVYNLPWHSGKTLVALYGSICTADLDAVYLESYANWGPLWDSDTTITHYMDSWDWIYDFITHEIGLTGTYGIDDRVTNLNTAKGIVQYDYNKYSGAQDALEDYIP